MNNFYYYLLCFLVIDLAVSALVLIWMFGARRVVAGAYAAEVSAPDSSSGVVSAPKAVLPENGTMSSGEAQGVGQNIQEKRHRVQAETVVQAEEMSRYAGGMPVGQSPPNHLNYRIVQFKQFAISEI